MVYQMCDFGAVIKLVKLEVRACNRICADLAHIESEITVTRLMQPYLC